MGYTTRFEGEFALDKPLADEHREYLRAFNQTRRVARDEEAAASLPDPVRVAAGLPVGKYGQYFVGASGHMGQDRDASIIDFNVPPGGARTGWVRLDTARKLTKAEVQLFAQSGRPWLVTMYEQIIGKRCDHGHKHHKDETIECRLGFTTLPDPTNEQPGLWCQWTPNEDGTAIVWDESEKFYNYVGWIAYLIGHFIEPWGYTLTGEMRWDGEDPDDFGLLEVHNNTVQARQGRIVYG